MPEMLTQSRPTVSGATVGARSSSRELSTRRRATGAFAGMAQSACPAFQAGEWQARLAARAGTAHGGESRSEWQVALSFPGSGRCCGSRAVEFQLSGLAWCRELVLIPWQKAAGRSRVVLVCAPAGYGKSTLVAQWADLDPRPSGWVQLGHGDNDPVVLLARVAAALERTGPVRGELLEELSRPTRRIDEVGLPLLAAELGERDPFVLVLDDVDVVTAEKSRAILGFLVDQVRSGSQLVLVSRGDPGVPLGRLRASGDLVEIGTELLALDAQETRDVAASGGLELSEEAAEALRERTEGWAAAVALATLSLRGRDDADMRAAGLSGNQEQIADYLLEEVLKRQPEHLKRFLLGTSILDRMTAPLCDAVLGTADAAISLETLARSNAFVVPLDDRREWYRYHHLFSDLLRAELKWRHPELLPVYLGRAAGWCEQHGTPGRGVRLRA